MTEATLQTVIDHFLPSYQATHRLTPDQAKACRHIAMCRTEALGGQYLHCDRCPFEQAQYHSCRDRHCPQCQTRANQQWYEKQHQAILPIPYFHLVFTLPHELNPWIATRPKWFYQLLFESVWGVLQHFGADKKRLDGQLGMSAVLHTWGQKLNRHVHLHCILPGGALATDRQQWHPAKSNYLFPVKALSRRFRGSLVSAVRHAVQDGTLHPCAANLTIDQALDRIMSKENVVYSKPFPDRPEHIVQYLSRYVRKIAISNRRITQMDDQCVQFDYRDYRDNQYKTLSLTGETFLHRFLLHVLPKGFMRVRHFGFLANRCRARKLDTIRHCLDQPTQASENTNGNDQKTPAATVTSICPKCKQGRLQYREILPAWQRRR